MKLVPSLSWSRSWSWSQGVLIPIFLLAALALLSTGSAFARGLLAEYPHWPKDQLAALLRIDRFVERNAGKGMIAVFDFDGTICSEQYPVAGLELRSGQSAWRIWVANHLERFPRAFPKLRLHDSTAADRERILLHDNLLEGYTNVRAAGYMKFSQLACFETGMSISELDETVQPFFTDYPPRKFVFLPMLDLLQRLLDKGFRVWVVTGSSPWFVRSFLDKAARECTREGGLSYDFKGILGEGVGIYSRANPTGSRILGHFPLLDKHGRLSGVFDDRAFRFPDGRLTTLEREGKVSALENWIEKQENGRAGFFAGNSDGDAKLMETILSRPDTLGLFVNPRGDTFKGLGGPGALVVRMPSESDF